MRAVVTAILIASALLYAYTFQLAYAGGLLFTTSAIFVITIAFAVTLYLKPNESALSPMFILLLLHLYANTLRISMYLTHPYLYEAVYYVNIYPDMINRAMVMVLVGSIMICIGYSIAMMRTPAKLPSGAGFRLNFTRVWLLGALLVAAVMYYVGQSTDADILSAKRILVDAEGNRFRYGALRFSIELAIAALQLIFITALLDRKIRPVFAIVPAALIAFAGIMVGVRAFVLIVAFTYAAVLLRSITLKRLTGLAVFATIALGFILLITWFRSAETIEPYLVDDSLSNWVATAIGFMIVGANFGGVIPTVISTVWIESEVPWLLGRTFALDPIAQFIPRSIWLDKPEELGGQIRIIHQELNLVPQHIEGGVPPGIFAEAWLNFRMPGVIVISLLYGWFLGELFRWLLASLVANNYLLAALIICVFFDMTFFFYGGHMARASLYTVQHIVGVVFVYLFILTRHRASSHPRVGRSAPGATPPSGPRARRSTTPFREATNVTTEGATE